MKIRNYVRAQSLEEAWDLLQQNRRNRIVGGMLWLKMVDVPVPAAIDLCDLGLDTIKERADGFSIGAMTTLRQLELHPGLNAYTHGAAAKAVGDIVGVQFRNLATVGGSVYGRFGFSDVLTVLLALDTQVELYREGLIPLEKFAVRTEKERDILVRLHIKKRPGAFAYTAMRNTRTDFPVLTAAASRMEGEYRVVLGARPGRAMVLRDDRGLLTAGLTAQTAAAFAADAAARTPTGSNVRASAAYRTHLVRVLTQRVLLELGGMQDGN